jgi:SpoVK/Ycf46/Vps4 family AAA+-type ATPase
MNILKNSALFFLLKTDSENRKVSENNDILGSLEKIVEISKKYGIDRCFSKGKAHLDYVTGKLDISPIQAVLFSHFMERSACRQIMLSEIADSFKCSKIRVLKYLNECEALEKKKLIRCARDRENDCISFRVPRDVKTSLAKNDAFKPERNENLSIFDFFTVLEQLFAEKENHELTFDSLKTELQELININMHLLFCKKIMSYKLKEDDLVLLILFCHLYGNNNDDHIGFHDLNFLFDDNRTAKYKKRSLSDGSHILVEHKYVVFTNDNGFVNKESWKVSDTAKKELLSELNIEKRNYRKNLILHDSIQCKKMFYNERENESIQKLISLLKEENYQKVQGRLSDNGMRKGFACLFSGTPGTGKTETAYQIARETGRNIMMIDISNTKSCWFGESEKIIKEIFDTYRHAVENSELAPILLLNEADAVIGKRQEFNGSSRAVDQTENAIQNIILQEMENLSGILIATTNLTQNMDSAFERRFLYKIEFSKPCLEARQSIWQSMMPSLSSSETDKLASRYDLSGGQIENIARKVEVDLVINSGEISMDTLASHCMDESSNQFNTSKKIGFAHE